MSTRKVYEGEWVGGTPKCGEYRDMPPVSKEISPLDETPGTRRLPAVFRQTASPSPSFKTPYERRRPTKNQEVHIRLYGPEGISILTPPEVQL